MAAAVLGIALLVAMGLWLRPSAGAGKKASEEHMTRFLLPLPEQTVFGTYDQPVLSPDGKRVVFSARNEKNGFFVHSLDTLETRHYDGPEEFWSPIWSPDGRFVAFLGSGALKKVDLLSGAVTVICDSGHGFGGAWGPDDVILFGSSLGVMWVRAAGGKPVLVTQVDPGKGEIFHSWPSFLPDGDHFLYTVAAARPESRGAYIGSLSSSSGPPRRILADATYAQYSPLGYLVFNRANDLLAQRFDVRSLRLSGDPSLIAQGVAAISNFSFAAFSIAGSSLVYRVGSGWAVVQMELRDRKGNRLGTVGPPADYSNPALSPDGRALAVSKRDPATRTRDIWLFDPARGTNQRLTFDPADDSSQTWSSDSQRIIFTSNRKGHRDIWQKAASGTGDDELVFASDGEKSVDDWTHDGRYVVYGAYATGLKREEWALPLSGNRKPFPVVQRLGFVWEAQVSPNGKWIAYDSDESGKREIYVQDFPSGGGRWQVSTDGGDEPEWNPNGKELFYLHGPKLMAVDVRTDTGRFEQGAPHALFEVSFGNLQRNAYAVAPDGQRFLVNTRFQSTDRLPMTVVLNWPAALSSS